MSLDDWNQRYRTRDTLDEQPAAMLVEALEGVPPGRALDLACGAGRNAVWLAREGWEVVALDGADEAIRLLREREPSIDARVYNLEAGAALPFENASFDLVVILYYLHRPLFAEAKRLVRPGGLVVTAALMTGRFAAKPGELVQHFECFEVLRQQESEISELVVRRFGVR